MFSTYTYPEKSSVPRPPVPGNTLGTVNPSFNKISTSSISGTAQGEYINSQMDAKQGVAQYTPIVQNIPCKVNHDNKIFPKGTLVLFSDYTPVSKGINAKMGYPTSRLSEPVPVATVAFNTAESQNLNKLVPGIVFPLSESTRVYKNRSQYIAVSVQDAGEIFVPEGNPSVSFKPGDRVYAKASANGVYHISEDKGDFMLGTSLIHQCFDSNCLTHSQCRSFQIALCPRRI